MSNEILPGKFYVHYRLFDYVDSEELEGYEGPFDTPLRAHRAKKRMDAELWISGEHVYYDTYVFIVEE